MGFVDLLRDRMLEIVAVEAFVCGYAGLVAHSVFTALKPTVPLAVFLMILQPMYAMSFSAVVRGWRRKAALLALVLLMYSIVFPLLTLGFAKAWMALLPSAAVILVGAVLVALAPVAMPAPAFVAVAGGDVELSVLSVVATFLASLVVMPAWGAVILHAVVRVPIGGLVAAILEFVVAPLIAGQVLKSVVARAGGEAAVRRVAHLLLAVSLLAMYWLIGVVFGSAAPVVARLGAAVVVVFALVYAYFAARFAVAWITSKLLRLPYREEVAILYSATANGALGMAVSVAAFGAAAAAGAVIAGPLGVLVEMVLLLKLLVRRRGGGRG